MKSKKLAEHTLMYLMLTVAFNLNLNSILLNSKEKFFMMKTELRNRMKRMMDTKLRKVKVRGTNILMNYRASKAKLLKSRV